MEVTKIGETYEVKQVTDKYIISGTIIKTVKGNAEITITTTDLNNIYIATISGDYRTTDDRLQFNFNTAIPNYEDQILIMNTIIDTIKNVLNA